MEKCRLCLTESSKFSEVTEIREGFPLSVIAMIICPIRIEQEDNLPKIICDECVEILLASYRLRETSNKNDRFLRELQDSAKDMQVEFLEPENYEGKMLKVLAQESLEDDQILCYEESTEEDLVDDLQSFVEIQTAFQVECSNMQNKKSAVWSYFGFLQEQSGKLVESESDFYYCKICVEQLQTLKPKYKIESVATSVLFAHLEKVHGLLKSEMYENSSLSHCQQVSELVVCEICIRTFNSNSLSIHEAIEHENGQLERKRDEKLQQKVNCFKNSSKSLAWEYFGALVDENEEPIDEYHFYCRLCVEEEGKLSPKYTKNTSTSILLQHLKNSHLPKTEPKRKRPEPLIFTNSNKRLKSEDFSCKICDEKFDSKRMLNRHLEKEHDHEFPRNFLCDVEDCGKKFTIRDTLIKHIRSVHEDLKHPCDRCPTVLSTKMSLKRHIESCHLKLKMFFCDKCGANYSEQKSLKNHVQKVHLGIVEKKVPCEICGMSFPNLWSLRRHNLTHTREKPHQCHLCSTSYASKGDLAKHITKFHGETVYKCTFSGCSEGFRLLVDLRQHYKVHFESPDCPDEGNKEQVFEIIAEEYVE